MLCCACALKWPEELEKYQCQVHTWDHADIDIMGNMETSKLHFLKLSRGLQMYSDCWEIIGSHTLGYEVIARNLKSLRVLRGGSVKWMNHMTLTHKTDTTMFKTDIDILGEISINLTISLEPRYLSVTYFLTHLILKYN